MRNTPPLIGYTQRMRRPFWLIDGRLREAAFFLDAVRVAVDLDIARHNFSAFVSAYASIYDATDRALRDVDGFIDWWDEREAHLLTDPTVAYVWKVRNQIVHEGLNPLGVLTRGMIGDSEVLLVGEHLPLSEDNAVLVCGRAMYLIAATCAEVYTLWWSSLDLPAELTIADLSDSGMSFEAIELELGVPAGWSGGEGITSENRLQVLRAYSQTAAKELLWRYQDHRPPEDAVRDMSLSRVLKRRRSVRRRQSGDRMCEAAG